MGRMNDLIQKMVRKELPPPPIAQLVGFDVLSVDGGEAVAHLEADRRHHNPMGTLHGGVLCDLADAAMGMAYASMLGDGESFTTLELKINFLKAIRSGPL